MEETKSQSGNSNRWTLLLLMLLLVVALLSAGAAFAQLPASSPTGPAAQGNGPAQGTATRTATATPTICVGPRDYTMATATATIIPGTQDVGNHCDVCNTAITFPFPIAFYGVAYTSSVVPS